MGLLDALSDLVSSIGSGIAGAISPEGKISCACCTKCKKTFRGGDSKRVFICSDEYSVKDVGIYILATKVNDVLNCYPPCKKENFVPYNPEIPSEPNPEVYDYKYDWDENDKEVASDMSDEYYQK